MANNDDIQVDLNQDQDGQVVQNVPAGAQTTLAFKVEQSKVPEYFGQKSKDTNVANNLKGFAREWLFATTEMLDWTPAQLTWTNLKPRFQRQFATQTAEKMIMEGLSNLAMKPGESTGELLARITNTMVIIKESYASYENKPPAPDFDVNNGYTMPVCRQWKDDVLNNTQQFLKMQLFRAALTPELRKVVAQKDPNNMTLDDMYRITTDNQRGKTTMRRSLHSRGGKIKTSFRRKTFLTPLPSLRPIQDTKDIHPTTRTPPDQETTTAGMGNTASTANCKITLRTNVSREFEKRNRAETAKAEPIGQECI